jgi:hypothetical protein
MIMLDIKTVRSPTLIDKPSCELCELPIYCKGYCTRHYWRYRKYGDPQGGLEHVGARKAPRFEETDDLENSKICTKCGKRLSLQAFNRDKSRKDGYQYRCKNCYRDWYNEHYAESEDFRNKRSAHFAKYYAEKYPTLQAQKEATKFFAMYGITREEFAEMSTAQRDLCKICNRPPTGKTRLSVDHDHTTGIIRGLLCDPCNKGLGHFRDDINLLAAAIEYLQSSSSPES